MGLHNSGFHFNWERWEPGTSILIDPTYQFPTALPKRHDRATGAASGTSASERTVVAGARFRRIGARGRLRAGAAMAVMTGGRRRAFRHARLEQKVTRKERADMQNHTSRRAFLRGGFLVAGVFSAYVLVIPYALIALQKGFSVNRKAVKTV